LQTFKLLRGRGKSKTCHSRLVFNSREVLRVFSFHTLTLSSASTPSPYEVLPLRHLCP
jgi:hypothetical protein